MEKEKEEKMIPEWLHTFNVKVVKNDILLFDSNNQPKGTTTKLRCDDESKALIGLVKGSTINIDLRKYIIREITLLTDMVAKEKPLNSVYFNVSIIVEDSTEE